MIAVKQADISAIPLINQLANAIWPDSYKGIISSEQIAYMLNMMYSEESLYDQIQNKKHCFLIAFKNDTAVGYSSYSPKIMNNIESCAAYRLHKLYVSIDQQGKGIGKILLNAVIEHIKPSGAKLLELNVNKQNPAFLFYKKNGFEILREEVLDIGNGFVMDDYVMRKELTPGP